MSKRLGRVAGALGVRHQLSDALARCTGDHRQLDSHLFEVGGGVVDVVLFGVSEGGADVSGGVLDWDLVERREPRQLRE